MSGRPGMHGPLRRSWQCRHCGRTVFLITSLRDYTPPPCNHHGTVCAHDLPYTMSRGPRPGPSR